jgi:8-oxo-dGTP pyrophosphatase MutT (NUDIX family)
MSVLRFHHVGDWDSSHVSTGWAPSSLDLPEEAKALVEREWAAAAGRKDKKLFDGPMCRLESWSVRGGRMELTFSRTSYKVFWGTNLCHPDLGDRYGRRALANPVGVSPALETADGFLMLGLRNASVAYYPSRLHPFAGCLEPGDVLRGGESPPPDLFAAVRRELAEELSLSDADVPLVRCTGIVEDVSLRQPELIFRVRTRLTRSEVEARVDRAEHHDSFAFPATRERMLAVVHDPLLTPVGVASLLLWGRSAFGEGWFAEQSPSFIARS